VLLFLFLVTVTVYSQQSNMRTVKERLRCFSGTDAHKISHPFLLVFLVSRRSRTITTVKMYSDTINISHIITVYSL